MDVRDRIKSAPMTRFQVRVVVICLLVNMADGFDVLVMSFTSIGVGDEWGLSGRELGVLLSSGLVGMAVGSLFVAPLADRVGRRKLTLACIVVCCLGLVLSALTPNWEMLAVFRAITGLGIGGMLASVGVLVAEYSNDRRRSTAIGLFSAGYPIGGAVGGAIAAVLISSSGWRSAFWFGAAVTGVLAVLVWRFIPESLDFLAGKRPAGALEKVNDLLRRMGRDEVGELPPTRERAAGDHEGALLRGGAALRTVLLCLAYTLLAAGFYFVATWTPRLLQSSGLSAEQGISGAVLISVGGIVGALAFSLLATRLPANLLTVALLVLGAVLMALFGLSTGNLALSLVAGVGLGLTLNGAIAGMYAITPTYYSAQSRATALGWVIGFGRLGAIVAPLLVGELVDGGWDPGDIYYLFVVPVLLAAVAVALVRANSSSRAAEPARV